MNFWKSFSKRSVLRQLGFVLVIFAILFPIAMWDSDTQVKVYFETGSVSITSDKYSMNIPYDIITSAELVPLAEAGEEVDSSFDNDIIRTGKWENEDWGEYYIVADLDTENCIAVHLNDGRLFVFSCKNDKKTAELYETLQTRLSPA